MDQAGQRHAVSAAAAALRAAGVTDPETTRYVPLTGGTYNAVVRLWLSDGRQWVVKIPPPPTTPAMSYESDLLRGESVFFTSAAGTGAPVPEIVHATFDAAAEPGPCLIMTTCPGKPWHESDPPVGGRERRRLRFELGRLVARLHTVTGPGFGYPAESLGPLSPTWRQAFAAMTDAVLADAQRYRAELPVPARRIGELFSAASDVLDDVTRPALVHFDLWEGNLLLDGAAGSPGTRSVSGIIDGERMFWGDPLADFVSLSLFGDAEQDTDLLSGYAEGGGTLAFDDSARLRLALYRSYLYLIMLIEAVPRDYPPEHRTWARQTVAPQLTTALHSADRLRHCRREQRPWPGWRSSS